MEEQTTSRRGGKRPGAGRKPTNATRPDNSQRRVRSIWCNEQEFREVQRILEAWRQQEKVGAEREILESAIV